jgi:hypothetical protein
MISKLNLPLAQGSLQEELDRTLGELPHRVLADLIDKKLREQNIRLSGPQLKAFTARVLQANTGVLSIDDGNPDKDVAITFTDQDHEEFGRRLDELVDKIPALTKDFLAKTSAEAFSLLKRRWRSEGSRHRKDIEAFRERLDQRWGTGIDGLRLLTTIAREFGGNISHGINQPDATARTLDVLRRLHARGCQITEEIIALLSGGFADGAMARWRTLHEIAAVSYLIGEHGEDLAERYSVHDIVETRKAARQYQRHARRLGQEPLRDEEMEQIESQYAAALTRYGREFGKAQGWAAAHLKNPDPKIADILEASKIDHLGPYYRMASHNVHANPKGVFFKLGLVRELNILLAGASDVGLADPGHATALSLMQISTVLLGLNTTIDNVITANMMLELVTEIGRDFEGSHELSLKDSASRDLV